MFCKEQHGSRNSFQVIINKEWEIISIEETEK